MSVSFVNLPFLAVIVSQPKRQERSLDTTIGSLDMGGASMQISFADSNPPANYSDTITLFGSQHTLYSRSYLCYGYTEALRQVCANATLKSPVSV